MSPSKPSTGTNLFGSPPCANIILVMCGSPVLVCRVYKVFKVKTLKVSKHPSVNTVGTSGQGMLEVWQVNWYFSTIFDGDSHSVCISSKIRSNFNIYILYIIYIFMYKKWNQSTLKFWTKYGKHYKKIGPYENKWHLTGLMLFCCFQSSMTGTIEAPTCEIVCDRTALFAVTINGLEKEKKKSTHRLTVLAQRDMDGV